MLDHVFIRAMDSFRRSLEEALLQRHALEERLQVDVLLGDVSWETSYTLPGEGMPPRVQAEITVDWPTWSQSSYRSWAIGEPGEEEPEMDVEIVLRVQRLASSPDLAVLLGAVPEAGPALMGEALERAAPAVEQQFDHTLERPQFAVEVTYEGVARLDESLLADSAQIDGHVGPVGSWVASTLVRLADLDLDFLPPEPEDVGPA
jgi:hypothetical protein